MRRHRYFDVTYGYQRYHFIERNISIFYYGNFSISHASIKNGGFLLVLWFPPPIKLTAMI